MQAIRFLKKHSLIGLSLCAFSSGVLAGGADAYVPVQNWSGFYVGGESGYVRGNANQSITFHDDWLTDGTQDDRFLASFTNQQLKANAFIGGVQAGYNYQIHHWVPGVVMDFDYMDLDKHYSSGVVLNAVSGSTYIVNSSYKTHWLLTLRPRLGYSLGRVLPYVTGGFAAAREKYSQSITQQNLVFTEEGKLAQTKIGWTAGVGTDVALNRRWHVMAEYLYVHLSRASVYSVGSIADYNTTHSVQLNAHVVRAGISYVFN